MHELQCGGSEFFLARQRQSESPLTVVYYQIPKGAVRDLAQHGLGADVRYVGYRDFNRGVYVNTTFDAFVKSAKTPRAAVACLAIKSAVQLTQHKDLCIFPREAIMPVFLLQFGLEKQRGQPQVMQLSKLATYLGEREASSQRSAAVPPVEPQCAGERSIIVEHENRCSTRPMRKDSHHRDPKRRFSREKGDQ